MNGNARSVVEECIDRVGPEIRLATPLGIGKSARFLNAFYRYARDHSDIELSIFTALSLHGLIPSSELERRLVEPLNDRLFGDYPELEYAIDRNRDELPDNVSVHEFYVQPGSQLNNPDTQQNYISTNYTHAVRDILSRDINVLTQLITPARDLQDHDEPMHSLSCNPDLSLDMFDQLESQAGRYVTVGEVNENLPYMYGDCLIPGSKFDFLVDRETNYKLFGPPSKPISNEDYAIGFHSSRLIPDGGTLQIGIGSLSEALTRMLILRQNDNEVYTELAESFPAMAISASTNQELLHSNSFQKGLYASTEMFVRGFEELYRNDILKRQVFDDPVLQEYVNDRDDDHSVTLELIDRLISTGRVSKSIDEHDLEFLKSTGILKTQVEIDGNQLKLPSGQTVSPDLSNPDTRETIRDDGLGEELKGGVIAHAGFFLGPESMYEFLRSLSESERRLISMSRISFVNQLYGQEKLKRLQRRKARFLNSALKVTALGAAASDALEDNRILSGVGGQYNFVAMAHALEDGRSVIMLPSTRSSGGEVESNIVWNYGHTTIPRHLRDIVVTEYGIADLRGLTDSECIIAMLSITDARFQDDLIEQAKKVGKLPEDWTIPEEYKQNTPETIDRWAEQQLTKKNISRFPFGSELTQEEQAIIKALRKLKRSFELEEISLQHINALSGVITYEDEAAPYLERMDLLETTSWKEYVLQKILLYALTLIGEI